MVLHRVIFEGKDDPMRKSRYTEEQIIAAIRSQEAGEKTADVCRRLGVHAHTFHRWKAKYGGMNVSEAKRLRELDEENRRLKHIVADLTLDNRALKDVLTKKW